MDARDRLHARAAEPAPGLSALDAELETIVYRLVQESLTNVVKHASASTRARERARCTTGELAIEVRDDGVGFDTGRRRRPATG